MTKTATPQRFSTVHDRFQVSEETLGYLAGEQAFVYAVESARRHARQYNATVTIYDLMAHRG